MPPLRLSLPNIRLVLLGPRILPKPLTQRRFSTLLPRHYHHHQTRPSSLILKPRTLIAPTASSFFQSRFLSSSVDKMGSVPESPARVRVFIAGGSYAGLCTTLNLLDLKEGFSPRMAREPYVHHPDLPEFDLEITIVDERDGFCMTFFSCLLPTRLRTDQ